METDTKSEPRIEEEEDEKLYDPTIMRREELERRSEILLRRRREAGQPINQRMACRLATEWLQSETHTDLLGDVEPNQYRVWYSRSEDSGDFIEIIITVEGRLYDWPSTHRWLTRMIRKSIDDQCRNVGTFVKAVPNDGVTHEDMSSNSTQ